MNEEVTEEGAVPGRRRIVVPWFWIGLAVVAGAYLTFIVAMLVATAAYSEPGDFFQALESREIRYSLFLSLVTCSVTGVLSLLLAVPVGYLLARGRFPGRAVLEAALDIPIVLPPMVIGLCLLILFQTGIGGLVEKVIPFTYTVFGVVLAQFVIGGGVRGADDEGNVREPVVAAGGRGDDIGLFAGESRVAGDVAGGVEGDVGCGECGVGAEFGGVRSGAGFCRGDADEDGGFTDDGVAGVECGEFGVGCGGEFVDGGVCDGGVSGGALGGGESLEPWG